MKIIWSEKGLITLKMIIGIILIASGIACAAGIIIAYCNAGAFDYASESNTVLTAEENRRIMASMIKNTIIAAVSGVICIFSNRINQAIDKELNRRWEIKQKKLEEKCRKKAAASAEYMALLSRYSTDDEHASTETKENAS